MPFEGLSSSERRPVILDAAARIFAKRGFTAARTADIAEAAGTSDALTFQHFATKAELYEAVLDCAADALRGRLRQSVSPGSVPKQLEQVIRAVIKFARMEPDAWQNLTDTGGSVEESVVDKRQDLHSEATEWVMGLLERRSRPTGKRVVEPLDAQAAITIGAILALAKMGKPDPRLIAWISALRM